MVAKQKKKTGTKRPRKAPGADRFPLIENALRKRTKADIIDLTLTLATEYPTLNHLKSSLRKRGLLE